eukprot:758066-Hanusia_phi.AAC.7
MRGEGRMGRERMGRERMGEERMGGEGRGKGVSEAGGQEEVFCGSPAKRRTKRRSRIRTRSRLVLMICDVDKPSDLKAL